MCLGCVYLGQFSNSVRNTYLSQSLQECLDGAVADPQFKNNSVMYLKSQGLIPVEGHTVYSIQRLEFSSESDSATFKQVTYSTVYQI